MILLRPCCRRRCTVMMGTKLRDFAPLPNLSLEELVPNDNFYRRLQGALGLSFVRDLVEDLYAACGRPSVDPVVFFKLQLALFFEDLRSERQLMEIVADRPSIRWYLGYDLNEPLPDHSGLTRIRERYGLVEVFRRFFEEIVELCVQAGFGVGRGTLLRLHQGGSERRSRFPGTKVGRRSSPRRRTLRWGGQGGRGSGRRREEPRDSRPTNGRGHHPPGTQRRQEGLDFEERSARPLLQERLPDAHLRLAGVENGSGGKPYDLDQSRQQARLPEAHYVVVDGGKARVILNVLVTPSEVTENRPLLDLLWSTAFRWNYLGLVVLRCFWCSAVPTCTLDLAELKLHRARADVAGRS